MSPDKGRVAVGFPCPSCDESGEADVLWMDNATGAITLHCRRCEHVWHLEGYAD